MQTKWVMSCQEDVRYKQQSVRWFQGAAHKKKKKVEGIKKKKKLFLFLCNLIQQRHVDDTEGLKFVSLTWSSVLFQYIVPELVSNEEYHGTDDVPKLQIMGKYGYGH